MVLFIHQVVGESRLSRASYSAPVERILIYGRECNLSLPKTPMVYHPTSTTVITTARRAQTWVVPVQSTGGQGSGPN